MATKVRKKIDGDVLICDARYKNAPLRIIDRPHEKSSLVARNQTKPTEENKETFGGEIEILFPPF